MLEFTDRPAERMRNQAFSTPGQLLRTVAARWWLVIGVGTITLAGGIAASALLPPSYTAAAQMVVDPTDLNLVQNELTPRLPAADAGVSAIETEARIIASDSVLRRVVDRLHLEQDREFFHRAVWRDGGWLENAMITLGAATPNAEADPALVALDALRRKVAAHRAERTYVIDVVVKSGDPSKAARIANTICAEYLAAKSDARATVARRAADELIARLDELRAAVRVADEKVAKFREDNELETADGRLLSDQQVTELATQVGAAAARTAEARVKVAETGGVNPDAVRSDDVRALRQQVADLTRSEAELSTRLGPDHPQMVQVRAQVAAANRALSAAIARVGAANRGDYDRSAASEQALATALGQMRPALTRNTQAQVTLREYEREAEARVSVYEAFLHRAHEAVEQERLDTTNARVITEAVPPRKRGFPPSPTVLLPGALLVGLGMGAGLALLGGLPSNRTVRGRHGLLGAREAGEAV